MNLNPGEIAQVNWQGEIFRVGHSFIMGRKINGTWFLYDQGSSADENLNPPAIFLGESLKKLKLNIKNNFKRINKGKVEFSVGSVCFITKLKCWD